MDAADPQFAMTVLARIKHLEVQVEKEHEVTEELKEGLQKQYAQFAQEMDAKDEEVKRLSLQNGAMKPVVEAALEYVRYIPGSDRSSVAEGRLIAAINAYSSECGG